MLKNKKSFFLGLLIFIIPFLGIPLSWRFGLIVFLSLILMLSSVKFELPENFSSRTLKSLKSRRKEEGNDTFFNKIENHPEPPIETPVFKQDVSVSSDIRPTSPEALPEEPKKIVAIKKTVRKARKKKNEQE